MKEIILRISGDLKKSQFIILPSYNHRYRGGYSTIRKK